jgi:hypothetical protein
MYNYNRQNEINLNIGLIRTKVAFENGYASFAMHSGTYVDDNYANEKIKYLNEAYVGLYLDQSKKQSFEVGIMPSYIGFESAATASNLTLSRSLLGENSPYFMTGVKYNYSPSSKWSFSGLLTNGWQRIAKPNKKALPSFGSQIVCKPSENATLNWSVFIGDESIAEDSDEETKRQIDSARNANVEMIVFAVDGDSVRDRIASNVRQEHALTPKALRLYGRQIAEQIKAAESR